MAEAKAVMSLQLLIQRLTLVQPPMDALVLAGSIAYSAELEALNIGQGVTTFHAVYFGNWIGMFMEKYVQVVHCSMYNIWL